MTSKNFVKLDIIVYFRILKKIRIKMTLTIFKFIIYPSCKTALNNGRVKLQIFKKLSLNFIFGQGSCLISDFARSKSSKVVLLQILLRFNIGIFNNNFAFCVAEFLEPVRSSFCSMLWLSGWFLLRKIINRMSVFYPVCLKKYWKKLDKHLWRGLICKSCAVTPQLT